MERSVFFNSVNNDRTAGAEDWARYFSSFISDGVYMAQSSSLQVTAAADMTVNVQPGKGYVRGYFYYLDEAMPITLPIADGVLDRIDRIVLRLDLSPLGRSITVQVKSSDPAASPIAPPLQRDDLVHEICLADVLVRKGVLSVSQANITDQRLNSALCGPVAAVVNQIDTTAFNAQLQAWFNDFMVASQADYESLISFLDGVRSNSAAQYAGLVDYVQGFKTGTEADILAWFATIQSVLDTNAATNLYNLIDALTPRIEAIEKTIFNDIEENPFIVRFDSLSALNVTGAWSAELQRVEC